MQHCQNHHFKTIYSSSGNLGFGPLRKIGALSSTSWKLKYKFPRWLVKLWMCLSQHQQQRYLVWHLPHKSKLRPTHFCWLTRFLLSDFEFSTLATLWQSVTFCQKVVPKPVRHQHDSPSTDFGEVKLCDYELDVLETILNIGKKVENWVRTNEILRICQKVVPW